MAAYQGAMLYDSFTDNPMRNPALTRAQYLICLATATWLCALTLVGVSFLHQYDKDANMMFMKMDLAACCTAISGHIMLFVIVFFPKRCIGERRFNFPRKDQPPADGGGSRVEKQDAQGGGYQEQRPPVNPRPQMHGGFGPPPPGGFPPPQQVGDSDSDTVVEEPKRDSVEKGPVRQLPGTFPGQG